MKQEQRVGTDGRNLKERLVHFDWLSFVSRVTAYWLSFHFNHRGKKVSIYVMVSVVPWRQNLMWWYFGQSVGSVLNFAWCSYFRGFLLMHIASTWLDFEDSSGIKQLKLKLYHAFKFVFNCHGWVGVLWCLNEAFKTWDDYTVYQELAVHVSLMAVTFF